MSLKPVAAWVCDFCGRHQWEVSLFSAKPLGAEATHHICRDCASKAVAALADQQPQQEANHA
ncbi:ClpX C4-type zinc finger protein [Achromobacter xylosoxidans]|uniref:ClpX C4-type zinc finger protein n=1 Tax=Alcaligenes xylosoxydans xylosoxydans TaxID=85698 RepID=UPI0022B8FA99|nr:ClpX C4-type zinc finger protein [Achromobacter xylosoxidans]MCZ8436860.1 hypothetical protein [Achromobacter xylosoxidans]